MDDRWDEKTAEQLPAPLKAFYLSILSTVNEIQEELILQENKHSEVVKNLVSCSKGSQEGEKFPFKVNFNIIL